MRITVGRRCVATVVCAAWLGSGCSIQPTHETSSSLPELTDFRNWTWGTADGTTPATDATPGKSVASQEPDRRPPGAIALPPGPEPIAVASLDDDLAPVVDHIVEIEPDPVVQQLRAEPDSVRRHTSVWPRVREGMRLPSGPTHLLRKHMKWIGTHERYFRRVTRRGAPYLFHILEEIDRRAMPMEIALLPIIESGFKPFAYSSGKAAGIWQIIPTTGKQLGLRTSWWYDGRRDILDSTDAALDYLQLVNNNLDGDWLLSIAAYNCGEGAVRRARAKAVANGKGTDFWSIRPYLPRETQAYVPRLLAVAAAVRDPKQFGLSLEPVANKPYFDVVKLRGQLDLAVAAKAAGLKLDELKNLNPGFGRWATDPDGPHRLLMPKSRTSAFRQAATDLPATQRMRWRHHRIQRGETLGQIAQAYGTRVDVLRRVNDLSTSNIRAGKDLVVPLAGQTEAPANALAEAKTRTVAKRSKARKTSTPRPSGPHHTVRPGESMWTIARRHNTTVAALARVNRIRPGDTLQIGQRLSLPTDRARAVGVSARSSRSVYTVRKGDSLWTIAKRTGVGLSDLRAWNGLTGSTMVKPGQVLYLQSPSTRRES